MYKDTQQESRQMYLPDDAGVDSAKKAIIYETWTRKSRGEDVWLVFVNAVGNEGDELTFAYPFSVEPHVKVKTIVRQAQIQHEQYGRPPKVGRPEVTKGVGIGIGDKHGDGVFSKMLQLVTDGKVKPAVRYMEPKKAAHGYAVAEIKEAAEALRQRMKSKP
jgi:hypothetical protein